MQESVALLKTTNAPLTPVQVTLSENNTKQQFLPLDVDVSPFDNSKTKKAGVSPVAAGTAA